MIPTPWERPEKCEELRFYRDLVHQEQNFFWSRFSVFAALHAGMLAIVSTETHRNSTFLIILGFALSLIWVFVQSASLWYVDRYKERYHNLKKEFAIKQKEHWLHGMPVLSSTNIAFYGTFLVVGIWGYLLWPTLAEWIGMTS